MKLKIGSIYYNVILKKKLKDDIWGYSDIQHCTIYILRSLSKQKRNQTLIHECVHIMLHEAGLDDHAFNEKLVLPLGNILYGFMKDNGGIIK
ncbi:ImmA/IrrE family metallo-endopeptidase [Lactobacillus acetotolerans]|uniref:ImmA/IrrE family metallo-endopeptidase n=1 Tax=Lactobacillus acetotolerans TaxID=1600 RepID=UPI002FD8913E